MIPNSTGVVKFHSIAMMLGYSIFIEYIDNKTRFSHLIINIKSEKEKVKQALKGQYYMGNTRKMICKLK
jgi:hypothetical protein